MKSFMGEGHDLEASVLAYVAAALMWPIPDRRIERALRHNEAAAALALFHRNCG